MLTKASYALLLVSCHVVCKFFFYFIFWFRNFIHRRRFFYVIFFYWNVTLNTCSQGLGPVSADVWMFICCTSGNLCRAAGGALSTWLSSHAAYRWKFPVGQLERLGAGRGGAEGTGWGRLFSWGGAVLVSDFFYLRALKQCSNNSDLWPPVFVCGRAQEVLHNCNVSKHGLLSFWCWLSLLMSSMFSWGPTVVLEEAKPAPHQELRLSKQNNWNSLKTPGTSQPS